MTKKNPKCFGLKEPYFLNGFNFAVQLYVFLSVYCKPDYLYLYIPYANNIEFILLFLLIYYNIIYFNACINGHYQIVRENKDKLSINSAEQRKKESEIERNRKRGNLKPAATGSSKDTKVSLGSSVL